jgi:putative MATE family efflux protein
MFEFISKRKKEEEMEKEETNILGTEKIGKLIRKFSIPCIISLLVNSLYNIVDQIFIGWGVGYLGNGATNVVFPLTMICLAFALMFGDGASAYLSLKLGENKKEEAAKGVGNGIAISAIIAIVFCIATLVFLPQLLNLFGCTENLREYALKYGKIIAIGLPFMIMGTTLNSIIRADGSPKYSMTSMLTGAILNTILDPIFIFVFKMGVEGAAIATVISQIVTFVLNIIYIKIFKSIKVSKDSFKLKGNVVKKVSTLGISSFITQMSIVFVMAAENNLLGKYGAQSEFGSEIPITVLGIVMKISQILNSIIIGIAAGAQPIFGYNYGARKFDRVKQTLKIVLGTSVIISTSAFILFQTIPDKLISIFGSGDEKYMEFACMAFRIYLMLTIFNGIQIPSGIFFQAIGKSSRSAILSLSRQILFLIPAMIIFSSMFGIKGVLFAGPFADLLAFIIASTLLIIEVKHLKQTNIKSEALPDDTSIDNKLSKHVVITVSREYGSGGRYVGRLIAEKLGIKLYDKEFIEKVAEKTGFSEEYIESNEQKRDALAVLNNGFYSEFNNSDELFIEESKLIKEVAEKESCVIIGRCADFILKDMENVIKVFIHSNMEDKIKRATEIYGLDKAKAEKEIKRIDKQRANHYKYYTEKEWNDSANYDISINSDTLGVEKTAKLICQIVEEKIETK